MVAAMTALKDLTGRRFGLLIANSLAAKRGRKTVWLCACDCGNSTTPSSSDLLRGKTKSCGCLRGAVPRHGAARRGKQIPEYGVWLQMRRRCDLPTHARYSDYGGRGIRVCNRWERFEHFIADMGPRPSDAHSIDRIKNDGDYEPGNCKWSTSKEQAANRRLARGRKLAA